MSFLKKKLFEFLGWKNNKAIYIAKKYLTKIKENEWYFRSLSHDQLREKTIEFKTRLTKKTKYISYTISLLKKQIVLNTNLNIKISLYKVISKKKKNLLKIEEEVLKELLPEAFSVMKETGKRFIANNEIFVQCSSFDKILSIDKTYVSLYKDKAFWKNTWISVGKSIIWDMVYYDSQLIGGIVLHYGKIAEMDTGEGKTLMATLAIYLNSLTGRGVHVVTVNDYLAKRDYSWMAPLMEFHGLSVDCIDNHSPNTVMRRQAYLADITYGTNNEFAFDYLRDNIVHTTGEIVQRELNYAIIDEIDSVLIDEGLTPIIISIPYSQINNKEFEVLKLQVKKIIQQQYIYLGKTLNEARELLLLGDKKKSGFKLLQVYRGFPKNITLIKYLSNDFVRSLLNKTEVQYMQDNYKEMSKIDENLYFTVNEKNHFIELTDKGIDMISTNLFEQDFFILNDISLEIKKIEEKKFSKKKENNKKKIILKDFYKKSIRIHIINQLLKAYILFEKDIDYIVLEGKVKIIDKQTGRIMEGHRYSNGIHQAIESKENVKIKEENQPIAMITLQNYFRMYRKLAGMTGTAETYSRKFWQIYNLDVIVIPSHKPTCRKDYQDILFKTKNEKYNAIIEEIIIKSQYEKRPVLVGTSSIEVSELLSRMLKIRKIPHNILNAKHHKKEADIIAESGKTGVVTIATNMAGRGTDIKLSLESKIAGGLAIIGSERYNSNRIDRQLRGRSGRQGDPGSSKFFVSIEDSLIRLFGSSRISMLIDKISHKKSDIIQHSMIIKYINIAQKKVEENNFYIRNNIYKYDEIINQQCKEIYNIRKHVMLITHISRYINTYIKKNIELYKKFDSLGSNHFYEMNQEHNAKKTLPFINYFYFSQKKEKKVYISFYDGKRYISVYFYLKKYLKYNGKNLIQELERSTLLSIIDSKWKEHIICMEELRHLVQTFIYEHKDPLLIYKGEAFNLFNRTLSYIKKETISFLFNSSLLKLDVNKFKEKWIYFIYI